MTDSKKAENTAVSFYEAIDTRNWRFFESLLADKVNVIMKSPEREKSVVMTNVEVSRMWQDQFAMVYDKTDHVIKNLESVPEDDGVIVKTDIDSTHYLGDEHWTGIGTYIFTVKDIDGIYKITGLNYTLQIVEGDVALRDRMVAKRKY